MTEVIILAIIALALFYYFNHRMKIRREERKERLHEKWEEYLIELIKKLKDKENTTKQKRPNSETNE